jgi:two-component system cell cycle response regulator DivK
MPSVLLVEDNEMNRDMLSRRLVRRGFEILLAQDGLTAIEMAKSEQPDVILLDMDLPVLDGWEAARRIRKDPSVKWIPIVALTAHAMSGDRERALEAGCDDYETKPIDLDSLLSKMTALMEARKRPSR